MVISPDVKHSLVLPKQLLLLNPVNLLQTLPFRLGPVDRGRITGRVQPVISQQCSLMKAARRERLRSRPDGGIYFLLSDKSFLTCVITEGKEVRSLLLPRYAATDTGGRGETHTHNAWVGVGG